MKKFHATILVVEDDKSDQFFIVRAFRKLGITDPIHVVNNGNEAIEYMMGKGRFSDRKTFAYPTFIMTDLKMPEKDGFDVLNHLKSHPNWAIIPTVVLSASSDPDDIKKAYTLGASSYHIKQAETPKLAEQLSVLYAYWKTCEVPEVDITGKRLATHSRGKLGERFDDSQVAEAGKRH